MNMKSMLMKMGIKEQELSNITASLLLAKKLLG